MSTLVPSESVLACILNQRGIAKKGSDRGSERARERERESRKSQRRVITVVQASQIPLYGGVPVLAIAKDHIEKVAVPLNLTFVVRSRAYILGRLVKSKFYKRIRCPLTLHGNKLGKPINLTDSCVYY